MSEKVTRTKTIEIAYVNEPKKPNQPGNVKDADGTYYKVWQTPKFGATARLSDFRANSTYEVEYLEGEYNGKPDLTVQRILSRSESQTTNGSNGHVAVSTPSNKDNQILAQLCIKSASIVLQGSNPTPDEVIGFASELYKRIPASRTFEAATVEATEEAEVEI